MVLLCPTNLKVCFYEDFSSVEGMRQKVGGAIPLPWLILHVLISYKCFEVVLPEKESVAVISSVHGLQQYAVLLHAAMYRYGCKASYQNFVCELWRPTLQHHGLWSIAEGRLTWKGDPAPTCMAVGMWSCELGGGLCHLSAGSCSSERGWACSLAVLLASHGCIILWMKKTQIMSWKVSGRHHQCWIFPNCFFFPCFSLQLCGNFHRN